MTADPLGNQVSNEEQPNFITAHLIQFAGTLLPTTSGPQRNVPISYGDRSSKDSISTPEAHRLTGIPKKNLDVLADSSSPFHVIVCWTFGDQDTPVFRTKFILVRGNQGGGGIVFSQNTDQEWNHAKRMWHGNRGPPDLYTVAMTLPPQIQHRPSSWPAYPATRGRRSARSKRHRGVADHQR